MLMDILLAEFKNSSAMDLSKITYPKNVHRTERSDGNIRLKLESPLALHSNQLPRLLPMSNHDYP